MWQVLIVTRTIAIAGGGVSLHSVVVRFGSYRAAEIAVDNANRKTLHDDYTKVEAIRLYKEQ